MKNALLSTIATCCLAISHCANANIPTEKPEVELTHWWNHSGEVAALNEIKRAVEARGGKFVDTKMPSWDKLRSSVINRLTVGYPPAITQWLGSREGLGLDGINAVYSPPAVWRDEPLKDVLLTKVFNDMVSDEKLVTLPLGIHIQNAALYNAAIYKELDLPLPSSWQMVIEQAPIIKAAGYIPLALSTETWQLLMVFNAILLDEVGLENYRLLYWEGRFMEKAKQPLIRAFNTLLTLKQFADSDHKGRSWNNAVEMVGKKQAAMHVMGDFAKGELTAMGLVAGEDFKCSLSPGSRGAMLYVVDGFLMLKTQEQYLREGQSILIDTVLDPDVQAAYNSKKGSIPVIKKGVDLDKLDSCSRELYKQWVAEDVPQQGAEPSESKIAPGTGTPLRASFFETVLREAWSTEDASAEKLVGKLLTMIDSSLKHADSLNVSAAQ